MIMSPSNEVNNKKYIYIKALTIILKPPNAIIVVHNLQHSNHERTILTCLILTLGTSEAPPVKHWTENMSKLNFPAANDIKQCYMENDCICHFEMYFLQNYSLKNN